MTCYPYERARLAGRVRRICTELSDIGDALSSLKSYQLATDAFEASIQLYALERELVELPPQTGAPTPLEESTDCREELPF
jgi:hypothetical protein